MFRIVEQYGDIFVKCPSHIPLAHCVSLDFHMGKGIAKLFNKNLAMSIFLNLKSKKLANVPPSIMKEGLFSIWPVNGAFFINRPMNR